MSNVQTAKIIPDEITVPVHLNIKWALDEITVEKIVKYLYHHKEDDAREHICNMFDMSRSEKTIDDFSNSELIDEVIDRLESFTDEETDKITEAWDIDTSNNPENLLDVQIMEAFDEARKNVNPYKLLDILNDLK